MKSSYDKMRGKMVRDQLERRGLRDEKLLHAFRSVPRHYFIPEGSRHLAYSDCAVPIGAGQTISQPYMVGVMTRLAAPAKGVRILEIGTGSGYQAAILAELGADVFSVERIEKLSGSADRVLRKLGYGNVQLKVADGTLGWPGQAPFDVILITAAAPGVPEPLTRQLRTGGRLIVPINDGVSQVLTVIHKTEQGLVHEKGERCVFVPLVGEFGYPGDC